jgi:catechol 2,3-dioxygenase-like lactoylglutathione lyase family enzyme
VQVALCTSNLPRSLELYSEAFGFRDAGGGAFYGSLLARIQQLGEDAATVLWWMVGGQELFQIELFAHTDPPQRPMAPDWRPCDLGWVRWGVVVEDLDACLAVLNSKSIAPITPPLREADLRRVCIRDPWTGIPIEILEGRVPGDAGRPATGEAPPGIAYGTVSVPDLDRARAFYIDGAGLSEERGTVLHRPEHEALWALEGAEASSFLIRAGDVLLEVVQYRDPVGRPRADDARLSDQGFMHMAIGVRSKSELEALAARLSEHGYPLTDPLPPGGSGGTYVLDDSGLTTEIIAVPPPLEAQYGFIAQPPPPFIEDGTPLEHAAGAADAATTQTQGESQ